MLYVEGSMWGEEHERLGMKYVRKYFHTWLEVCCTWLLLLITEYLKENYMLIMKRSTFSKGWETATVFDVKTQRKDFFLW